MDHGQAESAPETLGLDDLAGFLADTPETDPIEDDDTTAEPAPDESDNAEEAPNEQDEPAEDEADEPAPVEKITIKVKNEEGQEETLELTPDEIANGYMRQAAFTRKTQALSEREGQAVQFLKTKHDEIRSQYTQQAEFYKQAVTQMAGIRSEAEMSQLAQSDPAAWVAENQRQQSVRNFLNTLDQSIQTERQRAQAEAQQHQQQTIQQMTEKAWAELSKEKIDKPLLAKIYEGASKTYGFTADELGNVYDPRLVKMMRDATAYQSLKSKAPEVTRQAQAAPRMPTSRQTTPAAERQRTAINNRFSSGRGKLNDLAAYLSL